MRILRCGNRTLTFEHPRIMGVLNITPDSFSDGGRLYRETGVDLHAVKNLAQTMVEDGVKVLDVGGESTRPGAAPVSVEEESQRVMPVVAALSDLDIIISVDTRHAAVARDAIEAGAHLINDISAGSDPEMLGVIAGSGAGYAIMHMQGTPQTMQRGPHYDDVVEEVAAFLDERVDACVHAGISAECLIVDPGFGFGKTVAHNLQLLARLSELRIGDLPLLAGLSRKSTVGAITGRAVAERIHGSVAAALLAAERGADLLRVHDVAATADALKILHAVQQASAQTMPAMNTT